MPRQDYYVSISFVGAVQQDAMPLVCFRFAHRPYFKRKFEYRRRAGSRNSCSERASGRRRCGVSCPSERRRLNDEKQEEVQEIREEGHAIGGRRKLG
jgi:hypothetical protein